MGGKGSGRAPRDRTAEYAARRAARMSGTTGDVDTPDTPRVRRTRRTKAEMRAAVAPPFVAPRERERNPYFIVAGFLALVAVALWAARGRTITTMEPMDLYLADEKGGKEPLVDFLKKLTQQIGRDFGATRSQREKDHADHEELASRVNSLERWRAEQTKAAD